MPLLSAGRGPALTRRQLNALENREAKRKLKRALADNKAAVAKVKKSQRVSSAQARSLCSRRKQRASARMKARRKAVLDELRAESAKLRDAVKSVCTRDRKRIADRAGKQLRKLAEQAQARHDAFLRSRLPTAYEKDTRSIAERVSESDDAVERNIDPDLVGVWRKVKRKIKAGKFRDRTEAFEHWVHDNADDVAAMLSDEAERRTRDEVRELERQARAWRPLLSKKQLTVKDLERVGIKCDDLAELGLSCTDPQDVLEGARILEEERGPRKRRAA